MTASMPRNINDIDRRVIVDMQDNQNKDLTETASTTTKTEELLSRKEVQLELMWDKIQELKLTDPFAAQIMYEKYRLIAGEIPPSIPTCIIADQAVS